MHSLPIRLLFGVATLALAGRACGEIYEQTILPTLNEARINPGRYLEALRSYRGYFHGNTVILPGDRVRHLTVEGIRPVDEAIAALARQQASPPLQESALLDRSAADHAIEQQATGGIGHGDRFGMPENRIRAHGGGGLVAEVIAYGAGSGPDVIRQLIVDDGVADRGHRVALFDNSLRFAGAACRSHPIYRTVCVIDLAEAVNGSSLFPDRPLVKARAGEFVRSMSRLIAKLVSKERPAAVNAAHR